MPGGGLTYRLLSSLDNQWPIPIISVLQYVFEGDNRGDASIFVALLNRVLKLNLQSEFTSQFCGGYSDATPQESSSQKVGSRVYLGRRMTSLCLDEEWLYHVRSSLVLWTNTFLPLSPLPSPQTCKKSACETRKNNFCLSCSLLTVS